MILSIDTHHDITPDILSNISTQLEQGLQSGHVPYKWKIITDIKTAEIQELLDEIESDADDIDTAKHNIDLNKSKLEDLLDNLL